MVRKKKRDMWLKAGIIGALVTGSLYYNAKKFIVGNKLRKAILITSASAFILYNCHGDKLEKLGTKIYEGANSLFNNPIREENKFLYNKLSIYGKVIDSLSELKNNKFEIKTKINKSENKQAYQPILVKPKLELDNKLTEKEKPTSDVYWYPVKKGETLSGISEKISGKRNLYKTIADYNKIENPSDVPVGFPLRIPDEIIKSKSQLNKNNYPEKIGMIKRGETLEDFVSNNYGKNVDSKKIVSEIIYYNSKLGNDININGYKDVREVIIYLR